MRGTRIQLLTNVTSTIGGRHPTGAQGTVLEHDVTDNTITARMDNGRPQFLHPNEIKTLPAPRQ